MMVATCPRACFCRAIHGRLLRHRHCEEPLRRSNPDCRRGTILDCFAALAMTTVGVVRARCGPHCIQQ
ncbi:hypothetical protein FXV83_08750 [Bradyrhizobium hipponense]|uniref:Uncharacterized protein n=1 Tax=Bradyrhizobium hipponense TaxID=2605638 RepID=A0A5S4YR54_9BRAD|nr:hypothetical protein FXV83_08750 [Bradyrhizobium hipponense]